MKHLLLLAFMGLIFLKADTLSDIAGSNKELESKNQLEKTLTRELNDISKTLQKEEKLLKDTDLQINKLNGEIEKQQLIVDNIKGELIELEKSNKELLKEQKEIESKLTDLIARDFSYFLIIDGEYLESYDGVILNEALRSLGKITNKEFLDYSLKYEKASEKIKTSSKRLNNIQNSINELAVKKRNLENLKVGKTKLITNVKKEQDAYVARIQTIQKEKMELKKTLENLKILQQEESTKSTAITIPENFENARKLGSSYQASKVKTYKGDKTIAPLNKFTVQQKFGDYVDPIYGIKIFNESVVLRSVVSNEEVKNILDGKVIFAKETSLLKNVVIVENANGIHTIYAHLSKIAPTIQTGEKIKKGYVIGRVERDLTLEVTQQNYHINPLELISQ
ncbi:MAG: peptidoglycan DD-metalloendopeptidase family protein [Campylobacteraceae bacterium]|jgi:murein DD-endopeptidase MepM/ murein hydrolase activator NlpD|nr:peptidoglycan DD-metalloendopeptidase family protein [Campylobacteraceae bacterium]